MQKAIITASKLNKSINTYEILLMTKFSILDLNETYPATP